MTTVAIVGCGVIGAAIAYELSRIPHVEVMVLDPQPPAQASTGAALGVLMGIISQKTKGNAWHLRQTSLQRYETLIPELEALTGEAIPFNRQGILKLVFEPEEQAAWAALAEVRRAQGFSLQIWDADQVKQHAPHLDTGAIAFAVYSPQDRQVNPTALTHALIKAAQQNGATFHIGMAAEQIISLSQPPSPLQHCHQLKTTSGLLAVDWVVVAAGLGTTPLLASLHPSPTLSVRPVLGQAVRVQCDEPLGLPNFQPAFTGNDIHIVPLPPAEQGYEYWVGATVEFPDEAGAVAASPTQLQTVLEGAIALCPALKRAAIVEQWSGLRPRPYNRPAPVIEPLTGYDNVFLATGHYRNGILLAPATALRVKQLLLTKLGNSEDL